MDPSASLNVFDCEMRCEYKDRAYLVRNNGAILRLPREDRKPSPNDNVWTFGKKAPQSGYMVFSSCVRVHQVVCTAFHGPAPRPNMVVDHIDTNRCNNRPENLRWLTKLENILNNPITRAKVELICGSVEAFLENPGLLRDHESENSNFEWMRDVTKEEAEFSLARWRDWADKPLEERRSKGNGLGEWIYKPAPRYYPNKTKAASGETDAIKPDNGLGLKNSLTPGAKQLNWRTPSAFPQTPQTISSAPLQDYLDRLPKGTLFSHSQVGDSIVFDAAISEDGSHLAEISRITGATKYALCEITFENGYFVHKSIRTFFTEKGAIKYFTLSLGREWTGGDVLEDFC